VSGVVSSAESGDSGVSRRVFGNLLSWMANENKEAFIVMTMNRTLGVPPETLRAGRLDATFYTTFPSNSDREEILKIHFSLNNVDHTKLFSKSEWAELVKDTDEFVGAELEQLVLKALRTAYRKRKEIQPTFEDMKEARLTVSPMAVIDRDGIAEIDRWCKDRAIPVSKIKKSARVVSVSSQCRRSLGDPGSN
jgi:SpoVK/Ycf46/Vps4 family AAA+-type ATPase